MANAGNSLAWKILYGGGDSETAAAHCVVLQQAGYKTDSAIGRKAVEEAVRKAGYDLVVLGPTLTRDDRHHLPYIAKKANIHSKVLVMHTDGERHPYVDANTETGRGIADVVAKISLLAGAGKSAEKKMAAGAGTEG